MSLKGVGDHIDNDKGMFEWFWNIFKNTESADVSITCAMEEGLLTENKHSMMVRVTETIFS